MKSRVFTSPTSFVSQWKLLIKIRYVEDLADAVCQDITLRPGVYSAFDTRNSQALEVTGTIRFYRRTNLSGNLFLSICENSFHRDTFVLLLDTVFMLQHNQALTVRYPNRAGISNREENQTPQEAQDFAVVFDLCMLQLFSLSLLLI